MDEARARRLTLIACILGSSIVFVDQTVVNIALPSLRADLDATLADQQWVVEACLLLLSSLVLVGGALGDLYGRRRIFAIGTAGFGPASLPDRPAPEPVRDAVQATNVEAFRTGMIVSGLLMTAGGLIAAIGIENPRAGQCVDFSFSVDDNATRLPAAPGDWRVFIVCGAELATHFTARVAGDRPVRWAPARDSRRWGCGGVGQLPRKS